MDRTGHWEKIYGEKAAEALSWYRPHLDTSLQLIEQSACDHSAAIIDVGGGESTLVDDLLSRGYTNLAVLDISQIAIEETRRRLGRSANNLRWLVANITDIDFGELRFDVWHDRAAFHFLMSAEDRTAYVRQLARVMRPGGHVIMATFANDAPAKCSGLDVVRYDAPSLQRELGTMFTLRGTYREIHRTPQGIVQPFLYSSFSIQSACV